MSATAKIAALLRLRRPGRGREGSGPARLAKIAARTVSGVMAAMVTATAAATVVGFWLSYNGLHAFALRAGMSGPEAWAWPASVDLFIAAGEAGVTISALHRRRDPMAWAYLAAGFAASVTGNVLHVHPGHLPWPPYAVAAVPPAAAMAALAALLRIVYRMAMDTNAPQTVSRPRATVRTRQRASATRTGTPRQRVMAALVASPDVPASELVERFGVSVKTVTRARADLARARANGSSNGDSPREEAGQ